MTKNSLFDIIYQQRGRSFRSILMKSLKGERINKWIPISIGIVFVSILAAVLAIVFTVNKNNKIVNVSLDGTSVRDSYVLDEGVDIGTIQLYVRRASGKTVKVSLDENMLTRDDYNKLSTEGNHTIEAKYEGFTVKINIKIIDIHTVTFVINGAVAGQCIINNEQVLDSELIPSVDDKPGFRSVWLYTDDGDVKEADFTKPIVSNITFEAKYLANISVKAMGYFVNGDEERNVSINNNSNYTLYNIDEDGERIFDIVFKSGSSNVYLGEDLEFRINPSSKYNKYQTYVVYNNGNRLSKIDGAYRINNVQQSINITIGERDDDGNLTNGFRENTYNVTFMNVYLNTSGEIQYQKIGERKVNHGDSLVGAIDDPVWPIDEFYQGIIPAFEGWTEDLTSIKYDMIVYARYEGVQLYTVRIYQKTNNLNLCKTIFLAAKGEIEIPSEFEVKIDDTQQYVYTFLRWDYNVLDENGNVVATNSIDKGAHTVYIRDRSVELVAIFSTDSKEYEVSLYREDGSLFDTINVRYGTEDISTVKPEKAADKDHIYPFEYWSRTLGGSKFEWSSLTNEEKSLAKVTLYPVYGIAQREYGIRAIVGYGYSLVIGEDTYNTGDSFISGILAGTTFDFSVVYQDPYSQNANRENSVSINGENSTFDLSSTLVSYNTRNYAISNVYGDIEIVINAEKNTYAINFYDENGGSLVRTVNVMYDGNYTLPVLEFPSDYIKYAGYIYKWNEDGQSVGNQLTGIRKNHDIYVEYYHKYNLVIDGDSTVVEVEKDNESYSQFAVGAYMPNGLGEDKCIGWYLDEHFSIPYDEYASLTEYKLYTISATIDKFDNTGLYAKDTEISGTVVFPKLTNSHIEDEAFRDCAEITGVILPSTITSIGDNAFGGCLKLEYIVIGEVVSFGNYFKPNSTKVFYMGDQSNWDGVIRTGKPYYESVQFYSKVAPENDSEIQYWRYVNAKPISWGRNIVNDVEYEIRESSGTKYAVAIGYVGDKNFDGCLKIESLINGVPVTKIETDSSKTFQGLKIKQLLVPQGITIANNEFNWTTGLNRIFVYGNSVDITVETHSNNSIITDETIRYIYSYNSKAGKYWHFNERGEPEAWNEVKIGDYVYSINYENSTAVLITYDGSDQNIVIDKFTYNDVEYTITELASYAFASRDIKSCTLVGVEIIGKRAFRQCKLETITINSKLECIYEDAFDSTPYLKYVNVKSISDWETIEFKNMRSNPLSRPNADLYLYNTDTNLYNKVTKLTITGTILKMAYYGINLDELVIQEGAFISDWAFASAKISKVVISSNGQNTIVGYNSFVDTTEPSITYDGAPDWSKWTIDSTNTWLYNTWLYNLAHS